MGLSNATGSKQNWSMPINSGEAWQDLLGLTAAKAAELIEVHGWSVVDINGNERHVYSAVHDADAITVTDFAKMGVGSEIKAIGLATPAKYIKIASSATPVIGDWAVEEFAVVT